MIKTSYILICVVVFIAIIVSPAKSQEDKESPVNIGVDVYSTYVWR